MKVKRAPALPSTAAQDLRLQITWAFQRASLSGNGPEHCPAVSDQPHAMEYVQRRPRGQNNRGRNYSLLDRRLGRQCGGRQDAVRLNIGHAQIAGAYRLLGATTRSLRAMGRWG